MTIVDLNQFRRERMTRTPAARGTATGLALDRTDIAIANEIAAAKRMRAELQGQEQRRFALAAIEHIGIPSNGAQLSFLARASDLAVDAMSNANDHVAAVARAERTRDVIAEVAPGSIAALGADRRLARALDLSGEADDAMHRHMGAFFELRDVTSLGVAGRVEALLTLQGVLRASKREGSARARRFAITALRHGEPLARELEGFARELVADYRQWAGFAESWLIGAGGSRERSLQSLDWSLAHRARTPRANATVGMLLGEIVLLHGHREAAIEIFQTTRTRFAGVLPRHEISSARMLALRGLAA